MFKLDLKRQRNQRSNCQYLLVIEKAREFQKNIFCIIDYTKAFDCSDNKLENSKRDKSTRPPYLPLEKPIQVRKQKLELDVEQRTGFKLRKESIKAVHCHPAYLTYMRSTSCEMPGWM